MTGFTGARARVAAGSLLLVGLAAAACATPPPPGAPAGAAPARAPVLAEAAAPPPDPVPSAPPVAVPPAPPPGLGGALGGGLGGGLLPPSEPGASRTTITGCAAAATEADAARFPPPAATRGPARPEVQVTSTGLGLLVTHELTHACCLKAEITSKLEGQVVEIREKLVGTPCRCMCASTLRTAVGLPPGDYTLQLLLEGSGLPAERKVEQRQVSVKKLGG